MNTEVKKERSPYWDNIKGLLMLLVVFAHILFQLQDRSALIDHTVDYIYMFHMPAFVFVSGYFGKSKRSHSFAGIVKLVFLYFIFNSLICFAYGFTSLLTPMYSYWYLTALIAWRLTAHHIAKFRRITLILITIALFAGFYPSIDNTLSAARIICFYPYYMAGYLLSAEKNSELSKKEYLKRVPSGLLFLAGAGVLSFAAYDFFRFNDQALQMGGYSEPKDACGRIVLFITAFLAIYALRYLSPDKNIPLITMAGRNSLWIFLLHRPLTFLISDTINNMSAGMMILASAAAAPLICLIFGNDIIAPYFNRFADSGAEIFTGNSSNKINPAKLAVLFVTLGFAVSALLNNYPVPGSDTDQAPAASNPSENTSADIIYPIMTDEQKNAFDNAFRITFAGDLILLEDQVKRAYYDGEYDFSDVFEYAEPYISSADYAIGVFEGPMAGEDAGYTSSNFDDGKELYLNFPDSFASAVKAAGFDLVTNANNHLLDKGVNGAVRTIDILDSIGLDHTGSYRSAEEKNTSRIKLVECQGIKMAVLSYTYGCNYIDNSKLINGSLSYITSVISGTEG